MAVPLSAAAALGAYATANEHDAPAPSVVPQLLPLKGNGAELLLAKVTPDAAAPPVFRTVTVVALLVRPTVTLPNATSGGDAERLADAVAVPLPDSEMLTVPPAPAIV